MLRGAASRVAPLPLRLREGAHLKCYKWAGAKLKQGGRYFLLFEILVGITLSFSDIV